MVERNKAYKDKEKLNREKKIRKTRGRKKDQKIEHELRKIAHGTISPEDFDNNYGKSE